MNRPIYETRENLQKEKAVAQKLTGWFNHEADYNTYPDELYEVIKTPPRAPYDYCILKEGLISGIVEIKVRTNPHNQYSTYMISLEKVSQSTSHANIIGCPFYIVVQWADRLGRWKFSREQYTAGMGGRSDRGDPLDREPIIYIPIEHFDYLRER